MLNSLLVELVLVPKTPNVYINNTAKTIIPSKIIMIICIGSPCDFLIDTRLHLQIYRHNHYHNLAHMSLNHHMHNN